MTQPSDDDRRELGGVFAHPGVADAYEHRPPYPAEVFDVLERLIVDEPRAVLDIGAGDGALARPLATRVERVDAVDPSAAMIEAGRTRSGGRNPHLRWIESAVETATLDGPYALVTSGASLHWMRWRDTMNRLAPVMTANAQLAIVDHGPRDLPWRDDLVGVIRKHSRSRDYDPNFSIVDTLRKRGLFEVTGSTRCDPVFFRQTLSDYVEQFHSTASLAREHMTPQETTSFDHAVEEVVRPWITDDIVELKIVAELTWGRPLVRR